MAKRQNNQPSEGTLFLILEWFRSHLAGAATKNDLKLLTKTILMKLSEIKAAIAEAAAKNQEAFTEISSKVSAMQAQIDELIAGASDPDITDEAFLANLESLKTNAKALADIVPDAPATPTVPEAPTV